MTGSSVAVKGRSDRSRTHRLDGLGLRGLVACARKSRRRDRNAPQGGQPKSASVRKDGTAVPGRLPNSTSFSAPTIFCLGTSFGPDTTTRSNTGHVSWSSLISSSCSNSIGAGTNEKKASRNSTSAWETTTRLGCRSRACSTSTSNPNRRGIRLKMRIKEEWTSRQSGTADAAGVYAFRGFFGRYDVWVTVASDLRSFTTHLEKGKPNEWNLTLD